MDDFPRHHSAGKENLAILRDSKFLRDLENDSVDSDILEDELNDLHHLPIRLVNYSTAQELPINLNFPTFLLFLFLFFCVLI